MLYFERGASREGVGRAGKGCDLRRKCPFNEMKMSFDMAEQRTELIVELSLKRKREIWKIHFINVGNI